MNNILGIIVSFAYIGLLMIAAKYFEKFDKEGSRKFIHILLGNWWFIAMAFFDSLAWAIVPPIAFVIINYASYKWNIIKVMERDDENKESLGTVYFAFSLIPLVLLSYGFSDNKLIGLIGFFNMTYGDGFASLIGKTIKSKEYTVFGDKKSVAGSITMLLTSLIILITVFSYYGTAMLWVKAIIIAIVATVLEAISAKGTDNLTVPIVSSILAFFMI